MDEPNQFDFLIPTGEYDIAVRELLVRIFGDAIACKVPTMVCGTEDIQSSGALVSTIFTTFNAGTLLFVTILLTFISIFAFARTALDGEFLGKTWNTTYTALRMVAGIGFLLPMPNGYSTIQNFTMYVGLWSSGFGNQVNEAVSDHYLKKLQHSMIHREPMAGTIDQQFRDIFNMHMCVKFLNAQYANDGAKLTYKIHAPNSDLQTNSYEKITFVEQGTFLPPGTAPCGSFTIHQYLTSESQRSSDRAGVWGAAGFKNSPFHGEIIDGMESIATELAEEVRTAKTNLIKQQFNENSELANLANIAVSKFRSGMIVYDDQGNIKEVPKSEIMTLAEAEEFLQAYALIVARGQAKLTEQVLETQKKLNEKNLQEGSDSFIYKARQLLNSSGWMGVASTYSTVMDLASINFSKATERPYLLAMPTQAELRKFSEAGANSLLSNIDFLNKYYENVLSSDTAKRYIQNTKNRNGLSHDISSSLELPTITTSTISKIVEKKLSPSDAVGELYGDDVFHGIRNYVVKSLSISDQTDPLFQIKSIGDFVTTAAEVLVGLEIGTRTITAVFGVTTRAVTGNVIGSFTGVKEANTALVEGIQYILDGIFAFIKATTLGLLAIGYLFSTWLPATPFIAFTMATMGWLFGFIMLLFAVNIWGVMHVTPTRNDSFIGSETQGYLLMVALFFRPAIAVGALALAYVIAPPIINVINLTLIPFMYTTNSSTNFLSIITGTIFSLFLYFAVIKGVIIMIYSIPQSFPDEVMRVINAGIGDLGQSRSLGEMGAGAGAAMIAVSTGTRLEDTADQRLEKLMDRRREKAKEAEEQRKSDKASNFTVGSTGNNNNNSNRDPNRDWNEYL